MNRKTYLTILFCLAILLSVVGCDSDQPAPTPDSSAPVTITEPAVSPPAGPTPEPAITITPEPDLVPDTLAVLPAPLYYIGRATGQVMRLEQDGVTISQITAEPALVADFDVVGDWLAYTSDNSLITLNLASGERAVRVVGGSFDEEDYEASYRERISSPRLSPDGSQIVFAQNGIQTISLGVDNSVTHLLVNDTLPDFSDPNATIPEGPLRIFGGAEWSPDGQRLVVYFGYYPEAGNLGLYDFATGSFADLNDLPGVGLAPTCCAASWAADSQTLYIPSDVMIYGIPGLTRVDALARTVHPLVVHDFTIPDEPAQLFRSALPQPDGSLLTFVGQAYGPGENTPYALSRVTPDGAVAQLDEMGAANWLYLGREMLWSPDGSGIVLEETRYNSRWNEPGTLRWFYTDGRLPLTLPITGSALRWGSADSVIVSEPDLAALRQQALADFDVTIGEDVGELELLRVLAADRLLFAAFTTGFHSWDPARGHFIALYEWTGDGWQNLAQIDLSDAGMVGGEAVYGPDYLPQISQAFLNQEDIWLFAPGFVGAHGGLALLLRYADDALTPVAIGFNGSPGAGFIEDVTGDGWHDLVLDETDPYVFCYACGVRLASYSIMRWNGSEMVPWVATPVTGEGITAEDRDRINQALDLARAELWMDVEWLLHDVDPGSNETAQFNLAWLNLMTAGRSAFATDSPFPLLSRFFYGDYFGATFSFYDMTPAEILNLNGPWLAGTPGEGFFEMWLPTIVEVSSLALGVQPDNHGAYFLRGWARYLLDPGDLAARADIAQAALLNPSHTVYTEVAAYLNP